MTDSRSNLRIRYDDGIFDSIDIIGGCGGWASLIVFDRADIPDSDMMELRVRQRLLILLTVDATGEIVVRQACHLDPADSGQPEVPVFEIEQAVNDPAVRAEVLPLLSPVPASIDVARTTAVPPIWASAGQ